MPAQTQTLLDIIKERIAARGPISIAEYMELALSHPEFGYYTNKDPLGTKGDFITSPEISQIFGELIGLWLAEQWQAMGKPQTLLTELGPGRGTLMADMLRATKAIAGFHDAISVHLVETSPTLQQKQWQALSGKHPYITWHKDFSELPEKPLLLVANEFFDALPVRQFVHENGEWKERFITIVDGALQFTLPAEGKVKEQCEATEHIARAIGEHMNAQGGVALIVDYGYEGGSRGDTLQAVRDHQYHDPLLEPGTADLTAHVDFDFLKKAACGKHVVAWGPVSQGLFLSALGAHLRAATLCQNAPDSQKISIIAGLERLISLEKMGDLFKVLALTSSDIPKPEGF